MKTIKNCQNLPRIRVCETMIILADFLQLSKLL